MKRELKDVIHYYLPHDIDLYDPVLRPLTDITKEIEINGERFIPIEEILSDYRDDLELHAEFEDGVLMDLTLTYEDGNEDYIQEDRYTFRDFEKLLSWHFDLFGLIESGQAINVNNLEK